MGTWKYTWLRHEVSALIGLPASPDNAAVLLLLARNECVGVRSLLTMLLSHGLSCRRRAERASYKQDVRSDSVQMTTCSRSVSITTLRLHTMEILKLPFGNPNHTPSHCLVFQSYSISGEEFLLVTKPIYIVLLTVALC